MLLEETYVIPKNHVNFKALPLINNQDDELLDCAIAFIAPNGGGPNPSHSHLHDHLFTVLSGSIEIHCDNKIILLEAGTSIRVKGTSLHSVWNKSNLEAKVLGISLIQKDTIR